MGGLALLLLWGQATAWAQQADVPLDPLRQGASPGEQGQEEQGQEPEPQPEPQGQNQEQGQGAELDLDKGQEGITDAPSGPRRVIWILEPYNLEGDAARDLAIKAPAVFSRILSGSADQHVVAGRPAHLVPWLEKQPEVSSPCLEGVAPCNGPMEALVQSLGADLLVKGRLSRQGPRWTLRVQLYGPDGRLTLERSLQGGGVPGADKAVSPEKGLEELAYTAVRELFNATGRVEVVTEPPGAQVLLDGRVIGTSPLKTEVAVGIHEMEVLLDDHSPLTRSVRVVAGRQSQVKLRLSQRLATLMVDSTPVLGQIYVDAQHKGTAGEPIRLPPGEYELEVQAEGYKRRVLQIRLEPEESKVMSLTLEPRRPALQVTGLGEVETDSILARRYYLRAAYRFSSVSSGLSDSQGQLGNQDVSLEGLLANGELLEGVKADFGYHGLHLEGGYFWERWGVAALGLSIFSSSDTTVGQIMDGSVARNVDLDEFTRVEFKPAQLLYRYPYKNLFPTIQTGFGLASTSFQGTVDDAQRRRLSFEQDGFFWHFSVEASYFFDSWWFAHATVGIHRDLSHDDSDTQTFVGFGVGLTFEDPLGELGLRESATPPRSYQEGTP